MAGFAASSAAVGLSGSVAGSITGVIAFRAAQGVFGAMLQPTALALLRKNFPAEKLNAAIGVWGAVIGASTAAGPRSPPCCRPAGTPRACPPSAPLSWPA